MKIILKLGGSVITKKEGYKEVNREEIERISNVLKELWPSIKGNLTLINGAGSFGHAVVKRWKVNNGVFTDEEKLGFSDVYNACLGLSNYVVDELIKKGIPAFYIPPYFVAKQRDGKLKEFKGHVFLEKMAEGFLPVSGGSMVEDETLGKSIISGDRIIMALSKYFDIVAFGTDVDGVLDNEGNTIREISRENAEEVFPLLSTKEGDYTGAMLGKVKEIFNMPKGRVVYIFNARNTEQLEELLREGKITKGKFTKIFV